MDQTGDKKLPVFLSKAKQNDGWIKYCLLAEDLMDDQNQIVKGLLVDLYLSLLKGYTIEHPIILHNICAYKNFLRPTRYLRYRNPDVYRLYQECRQAETGYFFSRKKYKNSVDKVLHLLNYPKEEVLLNAYLESTAVWEHHLWETCFVNGYPADTPLCSIPKVEPILQIDTHDPAKDGIGVCFIRINPVFYPERQLLKRIDAIMKQYNRKLIF